MDMRFSKGYGSACAIAAAGLLAAAPAADAANVKPPPAKVGQTITVTSSNFTIGQLKLGLTQSQVRALLGKPSGNSGSTEPEYNQYGLELLFSAGKLQTINVASKLITVGSGSNKVGVGSTAAAVAAALPATNCTTAQYECYVTYSNNVQLSFQLTGAGKVAMIQIDSV